MGKYAKKLAPVTGCSACTSYLCTLKA